MCDLRIGLLGAGSMAGNHARVLDTMRGAEFIGIYDVDFNRATQLAAGSGAVAYSEVVPLLDDCQAVVIAASSSAHYDLTAKALEAGLYVLVEKPVCAQFVDACRLMELPEHLRSRVMVGHVERFNPAFAAFRELAAMGTPFSYTATRVSPWLERGQDVSVVLDLMSHDLDLLATLTGELPVHVSAVGVTAKSNALDHVTAVLQWENGTTATVTASKASQYKVRALTATCSDRVIEADLLRRTCTVHRAAAAEYECEGYRQEGTVTEMVVPPVEPLRAELEEFVAAAREHRQPAVSLADGYNALKLAVAIEEEACR